MKILFDTINIDKPALNFAFTEKWLENVVIDNNKKIKDLSIVFCSDDYILDLNKKYLNHNYFTDIITFDYSEKNHISGDIVISIDTVQSNARKYKSDFYTELHRVMVHGVLHMLGFDDKTDEQKKIMREKEDFYLSYSISNTNSIG